MRIDVGPFRITRMLVVVGLLGVGWLLATAPAVAYDRYSIDDDATHCHFCHGDFRQANYVSLSDGQNWGNLHDLHRQVMVSGDCDVCHGAGYFPVLLDDSDGGTGMESIGCIGCHGRAEDGTGSGTEGYGLALQRRHHLAGVGGDENGLTCVNCHPNAATAVPVPESVLPPYYANPGAGHPNIPTDPCNADGSENFAGAAFGIDNDGDFLADGDDPDCSAGGLTPGEVSGQALPDMLVTNNVLTAVTISYAVPCEATDHRIHYGPLSQVSAYGYTGATCGIGASGTYVWTLPPIDSLFFLVVADNGTNEGSYGLDKPPTGLPAERPPSAAAVACPLPQDLDNRCD